MVATELHVGCRSSRTTWSCGKAYETALANDDLEMFRRLAALGVDDGVVQARRYTP